MKICFTSIGPELDTEVDPRFGRARYFIIYNDQDDSHEVVDNQQNVNAGSGAGIQSATNVAQAGCEWVVSGHIGPKAMAVLQEAGIRVAVGATGTVAEAIQKFKDGELKETDGADVAQRW